MVAGHGLDDVGLPAVIVSPGPTALVPYAPPGTDARDDATEPLIHEHDVVLLSNHGATRLARRSRLPMAGWRVWSIARGSCSPRDGSGGSGR